MFSVALELQPQIDQLRVGLAEIEQLREENRRMRSEVSVLLPLYTTYLGEAQAHVKMLANYIS